MVTNILVLADLGAAGNLVKNLALLSNQVDWPLQENRFLRILDQYQSTTTLSNWLAIEYNLRFWKKYYQLDLSDTLDWAEYNKMCADTKLPIVFLNHSGFYQLKEFTQFKKNLQVIYICPETEHGLEWQIRSYCEKKGFDKLHDFTFESDKENQIKQHIKKYGKESYFHCNIQNMKFIINARQQKMKEVIKNFIPLEYLVDGSKDELYNVFCDRTKLYINRSHFVEVVQLWRKLHWSWEDTYEWKYSSVT